MSRVHAATKGHVGVCGPAAAGGRVDFCELHYHQRLCRALWSMSQPGAMLVAVAHVALEKLYCYPLISVACAVSEGGS